MMDKKPNVFGIRHLSPAGAYFVREYMDELKPELVLIEGPSDLTELLEDLGREEVRPPVAVMAYTRELPIRTILYPLSVYSPEYQAILWAREQGCPCRFCDLPSDIFLGLQAAGEEASIQASEEKGSKAGGMDRSGFVYRQLDRLSPDGDHESFWERTMEQTADHRAYRRGTEEFGRSLRELTLENDREGAESRLREAYMRRMVEEAVKEGIPAEKILVVTGAFHIEGILNGEPGITDGELKRLPSLKSQKTLMPYSYYRLSGRSGYGAGNQAPAYYELLWEGMLKKDADYIACRYLSGIAGCQRERGGLVSSAEVIEAVRLAYSLAELKGGRIPVLRDLRDAAVTLMGHGHFSEIALAAAQVETGTRIGSLPEGVSQTPVQSDFYHRLKELKLEKYKTAVRTELGLDLREKLRVQSEKAAFMDLERSFFLHRLRILGISFAEPVRTRQETATWAEGWFLQWTPEAEIQIVEAVLKGDTIELAAAFELKERAERAASIASLGGVIEDAFYCGMPEAVAYGASSLQQMAVNAASVPELGTTAGRLSVVIRYGDIRRLDRSPLIPILCQLFFRACLILPEECICDDGAARQIAEAMITLNEVSAAHDFLETEGWEKALREIADRDDLNTKLSGLAAAILLERGRIDSRELGRYVEFRLSKGIPAELGAGWFEGLSMKNHYSLIARLTLWEKLSQYLDSLDDEEFKRALVFLRRAFADFNSAEKDQIAENLGEIWQVNPAQVSELLNEPLSEEASQFLGGLDDFDFGDI